MASASGSIDRPRSSAVWSQVSSTIARDLERAIQMGHTRRACEGPRVLLAIFYPDISEISNLGSNPLEEGDDSAMAAVRGATTTSWEATLWREATTRRWPRCAARRRRARRVP